MKELSIIQQYEKQIKRIEKYIAKKAMQGVDVSKFAMPKRPKRITAKSVEKVKNIKASRIRKKLGINAKGVRIPTTRTTGKAKTTKAQKPKKTNIPKVQKPKKTATPKVEAPEVPDLPEVSEEFMRRFEKEQLEEHIFKAFSADQLRFKGDYIIDVTTGEAWKKEDLIKEGIMEKWQIDQIPYGKSGLPKEELTDEDKIDLASFTIEKLKSEILSKFQGKYLDYAKAQAQAFNKTQQEAQEQMNQAYKILSDYLQEALNKSGALVVGANVIEHYDELQEIIDDIIRYITTGDNLEASNFISKFYFIINSSPLSISEMKELNKDFSGIGESWEDYD